jgi:hypothetical protein
MQPTKLDVRGEHSMKRNIVWTLFFVVMLSLSLAAVAKDKDKEDKDGCTCSPAKVAGTWGYSETGTIILPVAAYGLPAGPNAYASVGSYTLARDGKVSGYRIASLGGIKLEATIGGDATVNPDCTGTISLKFNGEASPSAEKFIIYVDNANEARMIITKGSFPSVLVTEAKKLFPDGDEEHFGH